jgi:hypothetical protein
LNLNYLTDRPGAGAGKKGIQNMQPSFAMLLKTNGEEKAIFCLARMFMKTGSLCDAGQDVDERIGGYEELSRGSEVRCPRSQGQRWGTRKSVLQADERAFGSPP